MQITFGAANGGYVSNTSALAFTAHASNVYPKAANHWGVYDAATAGNLLYYFPISYDVLCDIGVAVDIGIGSLVIKET